MGGIFLLEECCQGLSGMDFGSAVSTNKNAPAQICRGVNFNYIIHWFPIRLLPGWNLKFQIMPVQTPFLRLPVSRKRHR